jgi:endonuclease/exonuclease/phosphatase family metal-dependent hydrolase
MNIFLKPGLLLLAAMWVGGGAAPPDRVWRGGSMPAGPGRCDLKIVSWNIERGEQWTAVAAFLEKLTPAVVLLQEVDMNARRTGNTNVAEQLASRLGLNYLFAAEFEELGQGARGKQAYHGQAILTSLPASSERIIRFGSQTGFWRPRWYLPNWAIAQRRTGGRIALVAELGSGPNRLVVYDVHLESRGGEEIRLRQIQEVIADTRRYPGDMPVLVAGDLNTRKNNSPAVGALLQAGFRKAAGQESTTMDGKALDWIFVRGPLSFTESTVYRDVRASDHYPLAVRIRYETQACRR